MPRKKSVLQQLIDEQAEELREEAKLPMADDLADEESDEIIQEEELSSDEEEEL